MTYLDRPWTRKPAGIRSAGPSHPARAAACPVFSILLLLLLLPCTGCGSGGDLERTRIFQKAEERFENADSPEAFLEAAALYEEILKGGFENGAVLYNLGNAYMNAGRRGAAIAAYRRAKRYRPRDPFLDNNLQLALAPNLPPASPRTLLQHLLFWQDWLSYPEKYHLLLGLAGVTLLFTLCGLAIPRLSTLWRRLSLGAGALVLLAALSAGYDTYRFEWIRHGVVTARKVVARKGNGESFPPAFTEPLAEGQEFRVSSTREAWVLARLPGGVEGWLPAKDVTLF